MGDDVTERQRIGALAHDAFAKDCNWPPHAFSALVPALQSGWLAVADAVIWDRDKLIRAHVDSVIRAENAEAALADARRQAVEECAATRCNDCRDGRPIRLASDGWEHLFEKGGAFLCRAQEIRALLPPAGPGGGA